MFALFKKELSSFFSSLTGFITIVVFLLINGMLLWVLETDFNILRFGYSQIDGLFMLGPFVFLFLIPAITMRMFSEEKKTGTIEMLLTKPISDFGIIFSKFLSGITLVLFSILPTLVYYISVYQLGEPVGNIDSGATFGSYIGLFFLGAAFVSIGLFASVLTSNQIASFIIALFLSLFVYLGFETIYSFDLFGKADLFIKALGMSHHYTSISRGVVDTRDILYFLSVITVFLGLTYTLLQSRKWKK